MKYLFLCILAYIGVNACGAKASKDTSTSVVTVTSTSAEITVKLKKGLTKNEVQQILGDPDAIENPSYLNYTNWTYTKNVCSNDRPCYAHFDNITGLLTDISNLATKYVDINGF